MKALFQMLAAYNRWMNEKVYDAVCKIDSTSLFQDRGAYFKSIGGTLNHILVADIIWLKRYSNHDSEFQTLFPLDRFENPATLDQILHRDLQRLTPVRKQVDQILIDFCDEMIETDLKQSLTYENTRGVTFTGPFDALILHLFNHQTHHRGQVTTLLMQSGIDVGVTDLLEIIPTIESK